VAGVTTLVMVSASFLSGPYEPAHR
jgi:hypothetical protein